MYIYVILTVKPCTSPLHRNVCGRSHAHSKDLDPVIFGHLHSVESFSISIDDTSTYSFCLFFVDPLLTNFIDFLRDTGCKVDIEEFSKIFVLISFDDFIKF